MGDLPGVRARLPYLKRPRRRRGLAEPLLRLPAGRRRLRRGRLPRGGPDVRHPRGRRRPDPGRARPGPADHRRPGAQPLLRPARVVQARRCARAPARPLRRALPLPSRQGRRRRTAAQRLGVHLRRPGLDPRRPTAPTGTCTCSRPSSPTSTGTTRPSPTSSARVLRFWLDMRRRRLPHRRRARPGQGGGPARPRPRRPASSCSATRSCRSSTRTACTRSTAAGGRSSTSTPASGSRWPRRGRPTVERRAPYVAPGRAAPGLQLPVPGHPLERGRTCARSSTARWAPCAPVGAPATWVLSNHDVVRHSTRLAEGDEARGLRRARAASPGIRCS